MNKIKIAIQQMISVSENEMEHFLSECKIQKVKRKTILSSPNKVANDIFFINKGLIRVKIIDNKGAEHSIHFAMENQFITDYSSFIQQTESIYTLETLEDTEVVILPRNAIEWGYKNLAEGQKMGRLIAEYYFMYQDNRIKNTYCRSPKERYDTISEIFPNIHNRIPQHMIASYLGISSIHLSRLKKT